MTHRNQARQTPTISVVIPTFNRSNTLRRSVMSVLNQSFPVLEVIVVDDCSTDDTSTILASIKDDRLRIIQLPRQSGASAARNLGVKAAKGEWVAFQDSDDYWFAHKLERQIEVILKQPETKLCFCRFIQYYDGHANLVPPPNLVDASNDFHQQLCRTNFVSTQTIVVKRECFEKTEGFDETLHRLEDWEFALRLSKLEKFCFVEEPLVIVFDTPGNLTSDKRKNLDARKRLLEIHDVDFKKQPAILSHHYHVMAKTYLAIGDNRQGIEYFWKALRVTPTRVNSLYWLVIAVMRCVVSSIKREKRN